MKYTTLNQIKEYKPCSSGWEKLLASLNKTEADDEPLSFKHILDSNGIQDAIWALYALPLEEQASFRSSLVEMALRFFGESHSNNRSPRSVIKGMRKFVDDAYSDAAYVVNIAARSAYDAARAADTNTRYADYLAARVVTWGEVEQLFIKYFCEEKDIVMEVKQNKTLKLHGRYQFINENSKPLIYIGKCQGWNQFEEEHNRGVVWAELLDSDLYLIEEI